MAMAIAYQITVVTLVFTSSAVGDTAVINREKGCSPTSDSKQPVDATGKSYDPENFSKLKLNIEELFGSRWAINHKEGIGVVHSIDITDAGLINDNQLTLRVEFNLRQSWTPPGLEFPVGLFKDDDPEHTFIVVDDKVLKNIWSPNSYIPTARASNMRTVGNQLSLVYIFKNGTIVYMVRMSTKVGCTSNFRWYPVDVQTCVLVIESYKYQQDLYYHWTDERMYRPVKIKMQRLLQYELLLPPKYDNGSEERGGMGVRYPFVRLKLSFARKIGNNIIQVYTPTILVVILSWFSFWLGLDAIPGRITLLVTCMLTLVTMLAAMERSIPPVHYITMMDVWLVCCMAMVFGAMCEFIIVRYFHWRHQQKRNAKDNRMEKQARKQLLTFIHNAQEQLLKKSTSIRGQDHCMIRIPKNAWDVLGNPFHDSMEQPVDNALTSVVINSKAGYGNFVFCEDGEGTDVYKCKGDEMEKPRKGEFQKQRISDALKSGRVKSVPLWVVLDLWCRGLFPLLFCGFNVVYWPVLLTHNGTDGKGNDINTFYHYG